MSPSRYPYIVDTRAPWWQRYGAALATAAALLAFVALTALGTAIDQAETQEAGEPGSAAIEAMPSTVAQHYADGYIAGERAGRRSCLAQMAEARP